MTHIQTIQIGVPQILATEDEVWAMPVRRTLGIVNPVNATLEVSTEVGGTFTAVGVVAATGAFETAAPFIRNGTGTDCTVVLKAD